MKMAQSSASWRLTDSQTSTPRPPQPGIQPGRDFRLLGGDPGDLIVLDV